MITLPGIFTKPGDGGNYENAYIPWKTNYKTDSGIPDWTAFRESSFGVAELKIFNATHAKVTELAWVLEGKMAVAVFGLKLWNEGF